MGYGLVANKVDGFSSTATDIKYSEASSGGGTASADLNNTVANANDKGSFFCVTDNDLLTGHAAGGEGFTSLTLDVMIDPESFPFDSNYVVYKFENHDSGGWDPSNGYYLNVRSNGEVRFQIGTSAENVSRATSAAGLIDTDGGWYHLRGVWDGTNMALFIDDMETPVATAAFSGILANTAGALGIGCILREGDGSILSASGSYFDGLIDDVQIWGESSMVFLPGDANLDMQVDGDDAAILAANWLAADGAGWMNGDFNGDGAVNEIDATIMASNWQGSAAMAQIPEPATIVLLAIGLLLASLIRYRPATWRLHG